MIQLHGFSDASELAYAAAVYLRIVTIDDVVSVILVMAKTKVAPIKRLTVPRLELCGAVLLARLLYHVAKILSVPLEQTYAWTDSVVVLSWLRGNPRRLKTFVGNRISEIMELIPPNRWRHVGGPNNPADCASRGLFPSELVHFDMWWRGPDWLYQLESHWPRNPQVIAIPDPDEERDISNQVVLTAVEYEDPLLEQFSSYTRLKRVTAWIFRFIDRCRKIRLTPGSSPLTTEELKSAERHWIQRNTASRLWGRNCSAEER